MSEPRTRPRAAIETICPHLGIEEDSQTCLAYPSGWNLCHRSQPASVVLLGHQKTTCLSPAKRNPETKKALDECLFHNSDQKYCDLYGSSKGGEQAISM